MPSLEQIIRPFVVDPTTPPVPYITTANDPAPDPVRLNIGIGGTSLSSLSSKVAPVVPPKPSSTPAPSTAPKVTFKQLGSSYSMSFKDYMTGVVKEKTEDPFSGSGNPFGIGEGLP